MGLGYEIDREMRQERPVAEVARELLAGWMSTRRPNRSTLVWMQEVVDAARDLQARDEVPS